MVYLIYLHINLSRARAKLSQSQSKPESSEQSDSEEELPPTPPEKLLGLAAKRMTGRITSSTAQRVASPTVQQVASPTAQRVASPTAQQVASSAVQQVASPTAQRVASPTAQRVASPSCEAMFSKLLTIVAEIKETQKVHGKMLNVLLKTQDASVMEVPDGVIFPLQTQSDVEALEEKLGHRSLMSAVVSFSFFFFYFFSKMICNSLQNKNMYNITVNCMKATTSNV